MFVRSIQRELELWLRGAHRKPLVLRGARQVGKTTTVQIFGRQFRQFLSFNLERKEDRDLFDRDQPFDTLLKSLFFSRNCSIKEPSTLIFIDEIQNSERAVSTLRYFYEEAPEIAVIAAGSLLEVMIDSYRSSFPVGRVEFAYMHPLTFREYLNATGKSAALEAFDTIPLPDYAYATLRKLFHTYVLLGGMPEVIQRHVERDDLSELSAIYESLIASYIDDAGKYAHGRSAFQVLRHTIETAPLESGTRIQFQGFGNSTYRSREMGEALRTLERAMLLHLLYPVTGHELPLLPNRKRSPRLQFLDVGLMNYRARLQASLLEVTDLNDLYRGRVTEQIVGQELLARSSRHMETPMFWVREKHQSQAEVDFVLPYNGQVLPIEVKSGSTGRLRSLHQFIAQSGCTTAVRLYAGPLRLDSLETPAGHPFRLLNLPYFLAAQIEQYLAWMEK